VRREQVAVRVDDRVVIALPAHAEYCVMSPDAASCCRHEGTTCDELAGAPHVINVERVPGCHK
jgi:hypothetical protein